MKFRSCGILVVALATILSAGWGCSTDNGGAGTARAVISDSVAAVPTLAPGRLHDQVKSADGRTTYALYLPKKHAQSTVLPIIYGFDPQGDGRIFVHKYAALAERFGFILMGSAQSKNGQLPHQSKEIYAGMRAEALSRLGADADRQYAVGFSGGGRVASLMAQDFPDLQGMISCGAGLAAGLQKPPTHWMGIVGVTDFNFWEVYHQPTQIRAPRSEWEVLIFPGGHAWPDASVMQYGFLWLGALPAPTEQFATEIAASFREDSLAAIFYDTLPTIIQKWKRASLLEFKERLLRKVPPVDRAGSGQLTSPPNPSPTQQKLIASEAFEQAIRTQNDPVFRGADFALQKQVIDSYWAKIRNPRTPYFEANAFRRQLSMHSLIYYLQATQALNSNQLPLAKLLLDCYQKVDPQNPETRFMRAQVAARQGDEPATFSALQASVDLGFSDEKRLLQSPDFSSIQGKTEFLALYEQAKANPDW